MSKVLSKQQIGQRIAELRKTKGFSQEELAKSIKISRPSLAQVEKGNRSLDVLELQQLSQVLSFSIDDFMSEEFSIIEASISPEPKNTQIQEERISIPKLQIDKFKNVLLYILERCAGKPNVGETVLYKLLYFSDFNYYELYEEHLTGAEYLKLPYGPVPQRIDTIMNQMIENSQVQRIKVTYFDKVQTRYIPLVSPDLKALNGAEKDVIDKVMDQMSDWSASMISDYSHGDKPWKATENNEFIDYELAFYRRAPYSVRTYQDDEEDTI
jgi:transcriptional regulator with XRE-family HTH domain